jgi:hypothetical protein
MAVVGLGEEVDERPDEEADAEGRDDGESEK